MITPVEFVLLAFVLTAALAALALDDVLAAVLSFAVYSLGLSIIWAVLQAPDVALTEAAVGAGVMTIFFIVTLARTVRPESDQLFESINPKTAALSGAFVLVLWTTLPALPAIGDPNAPVVGYRVTEQYLSSSYAETGVKNAVTAVLAAYRGFDTFGEAVVVLTAGVVVLVALQQEEFV